MTDISYLYIVYKTDESKWIEDVFFSEEVARASKYSNKQIEIWGTDKMHEDFYNKMANGKFTWEFTDSEYKYLRECVPKLKFYGTLESKKES